jgi:hypothetical protein
MGVSNVTSQSSDQSRAKIIAKYFLHGFVFNLALWPASSAGWMFLALGGFLIGGIGLIIEYLIVGIVLAWINVSICRWLWDLEVQRAWPRLLIQGAILMVMIGIFVFLGTTLGQMLLSILSYEVYNAVALILNAVLFIPIGYLYKAVGALFSEP